jgi:hypothetical protein
MSIIIPRSVWGPRYANGFAVIGVDEWEAAGREIWLHHSVTNPPGPDATLEQDCQHMRDFEQIGQSRFGGGISYTWVTMPSGRVFQGHDIDRQGSHTYGRNDRARAICLAGQYHINPLPERMIASVATLLYELGATIDGPHSQVYPTDCPGEYARSRIPEINTRSLNPAPAGRPIEGEDMFIRKVDGDNKGTTALISGGIVTGIGNGAADETDRKAGGALMVGLTNSQWYDAVRKSQEQEAIPVLLREVSAKLDRLIELLTPEA